MYKIGELSKLCNISVKTLRYYDAEGLLIPDEIDKFTGYRYYSAAKLEECYRIIALKELGFSLDEIRTQLTADDDGKIAAALEAKLGELNHLIETTEKQLSKIEAIKNNLTKGEEKMFNIIIRATDEIRVAYIRKSYESKSDAIRELAEIEKGLPKAILGKRKIIINYETEYRERDFDLAACVELTGNLPKNTGFEEKIITFGPSVASLVCRADELDEAYRAMIKHFDGTEHKVCGAYYEIYHDDGTVELKVPVCARTDKALYSKDVDMPFVDDPEVCGRWKMIDIVPTREHFVYGKTKCGHLAWLDDLYFVDKGEPYWAVEGWTKGYLFTCGYDRETTFINRYTVESGGDRKLLFLEMCDYCDGGAVGKFDVPEIWVYEKVEDRHYHSKDEIRRVDNIDYPFIDDEAVRGVWKVRDFLINREDFDPNKQNWPADDLFLSQIEFKDRGVYVSTSQNGTNGITSVWTKGLVLNKREKTACAYDIEVIDGKEYLFRQWKPGDYIYAGRFYWYVFIRA